MGSQDAAVNSCNKLQINIKKIVYNSSSEVIAGWPNRVIIGLLKYSLNLLHLKPSFSVIQIINFKVFNIFLLLFSKWVLQFFYVCSPSCTYTFLMKSDVPNLLGKSSICKQRQRGAASPRRGYGHFAVAGYSSV